MSLSILKRKCKLSLKLSALQKYQSVLQKYPIASQGIQASLLMGAGDIIAQVAIEKKGYDNFDYSRLRNYSALGLIYVGPTLRVWYGFLDKVLPTAGRQLQYKKVLLDQGVFAPMFIASLVSSMTVMNGGSFEDVKEKLKQDYKDILITNYKIWPAVMIINFSLVPLHYQVLVTQSVAVLWNIYFSWKANKPVIEQDELSKR